MRNGRNAVENRSGFGGAKCPSIASRTRDRSSFVLVRSSGTDIHPWNQLRNEIPRGCRQARRVTSQIAELRDTEGTGEGIGLTFESRAPFVKGWSTSRRFVRSMYTGVSPAMSREPFYFRSLDQYRTGLFAKLLHGGARNDKRTPGGDRRGECWVVGWIETKKARVYFLYLCVVATASAGAFPHAKDRTCTAIWTKSPNPISWTDRQTDERTGARCCANKPWIVPTTSIWVHRGRMRL